MYRLRTRADSSLIHIEANSLPFFFSKLPYTLIVIRSALFLPLCLHFPQSARLFLIGLCLRYARVYSLHLNLVPP